MYTEPLFTLQSNSYIYYGKMMLKCTLILKLIKQSMPALKLTDEIYYGSAVTLVRLKIKSSKN